MEELRSLLEIHLGPLISLWTGVPSSASSSDQSPYFSLLQSPLYLTLSAAPKFLDHRLHLRSSSELAASSFSHSKFQSCSASFAFWLSRLGKKIKGVVNVVMRNASAIGDALLESPQVRKITFTGSTAVGKKLMAGAAATVKTVNM